MRAGMMGFAALVLLGCPGENGPDDEKDKVGIVWVPAPAGGTAPAPSPAPVPDPAPGPEPGPTAASGPDSWDADTPGTTSYELPIVASGQLYWRLVSLEYYPPDVSASQGGDHHLYFFARDEGGTLLADQTAKMTIFGTNDAFAATKGAVDGYRGNFAMFGTSWCTSDIDTGQAGPYAVRMTQDNLPSTVVSGMGLHCNGHMVWTLTFRKTVAP